MSRSLESPKQDAPNGHGKEGHRSLSTMMRQGRSFSGHERNCFFLNTGAASGPNARFANISAATGLDLPDDGRAVACVDWDDDGDLDLWISNRNGPRLRWMRNDAPNQNHFVLIDLVGDGKGTNRDAIGARVEVMVPGKTEKSIRTLRAGEGFLAQSSKWLHFGLGEADRIEKVVVRWPNTESSNRRVEEFSGLEVDGRYRLIQGHGKAEQVAVRQQLAPLEPSTPVVPPPSRAARVPLVTLFPVPKMILGPHESPVSTGAGKPVLINLWASYCAPCVEELAEFRDRAGEIRSAGLEVVALSVDGLEDERSSPAKAGQIIRKLSFPFPAGGANRQLVQQLQWYHDALIGTKRQLPIPSSFLIDGQGRLAVIYKGPVSVDDLLVDLNHSNGSRQERWLRAAPVPGRAIDHEKIAHTADSYEATVHFRQARKMAAQGLFEFTIYHLREAIQYRPDFGVAYLNLAEIYLRMGKLSDATAYLEQTIAVSPDTVPAHFELAQLYQRAGRGADAVEHYRIGLRLQPSDLPARNNLAWLLATFAGDTIRDGEEALRIATEVVQESGGRNPSYLNTLAAAQAEIGQFVEAAATARRAISIAQAANQDDLAAHIESRLRSYEQETTVRRSVP